MPRSSNLPSEEQFIAWLQDPCTQLLREYCRRQREQLKEMWADGNFSDPTSATSMAIKNAGATGACSAYQEIIEPVFQSLIDEVADEPAGEQVRTPPSGESRAD